MKRKTKTLTLIISTLLLVAFLTTSCQPTPEEPVVVNKANGELEKIIVKQTPLPEATLPPVEKVQESFKGKDDRVTINVDAEVMIPDAKKFPVVKIVPDEISMDFTKKVVDVLMEGKKVYEPRTQLSKPEIEAKILNLEQALADPENSKSDGLSSGDPETVKEVTRMFQNRIKIYKKLYKDAPDKYIPKEATLEFHPSKYYEDKQSYEENVADWSKDDNKQAKQLLDQYENEHQIILDSNLDNGYYARLTVNNYKGKRNQWSRIHFIKSKKINENVFCPEPDRENRQVCTLSEQEAKDMMRQLLDDLGFEDMEFEGFYPSVEREFDDDWNVIDEKICGYTASFQRKYEGIVTKNDLYACLSYPKDQQFGPIYQYENIRVTIAGNEIVAFEYNNPTKQIVQINENVSLKPFEDIYKAFKQQMSVEYTLEKLSHQAPENKNYKEFIESMLSGEIDIKEIEFCMIRVDVANSPGTYRMIPVWKFYGDEGVVFKNRKGKFNQRGGRLDSLYDYVTINAIDGSVVNQRGY